MPLLADNQTLFVRLVKPDRRSVEFVMYDVDQDGNREGVTAILCPKHFAAVRADPAAALTHMIEGFQESIYQARKAELLATLRRLALLEVVLPTLRAATLGRPPHRHRCTPCNITWSHDTSNLKPGSNEYEAAHRCPRCGHTITLILDYNVEPAREPAHA